MHLYNLSILFSCSTNPESSFDFPHTQNQDITAEPSDPEDTNTEEITVHCMDGFAPIPTENPVYCIMMCEASIADAGVISKVGELPSSNISYYDAQEYCSSIAHDPPMRLPTIEEWIDAGDGVLGDGGTHYPWGDDFHAGECILPYGEITWESHQTCGYLDTCSSTFAVYDQIGNLWEWAESGIHADINAWMLHQEEQEQVFSMSDNILHIDGENLHGVHPFVIGLSQFTIDIVDGAIWVRVTEPFRDDLPGVGYLKSNDLGSPSFRDFLPISLAWDEQRKNARIVVESYRDGEPIPAKVGGSFYSGADSRLDTVFWGHVPEFDGSIGFRCLYNLP